MSQTERLYSALLRRNRDAENDMPAAARADVAPNGLRQVLANTLQSSGDQAVNASTVLPWLFSVLGVPAALTGLLVPIRESGSMLPQAVLTPLVLRVRRRKWVFVAGAVVQSLSVAAMAVVAAVGEGLAAGVAIIVALAVFALGRCLCSIASKDVQGRTIPKGERGQINGLATTAAGVVAITLGLGVRLLGGEDLTPGQFAGLLGGAAALWAAVAIVYAGVREPLPEDAGDEGAGDSDEEGWFARTVTLLREDKPFRDFVVVRSLLLVSALSPPFVVMASIESGAGALTGLGGFVIASGLAALIGGRIFGRWADRSSRRVMSVGAALASAIIIAAVVVEALPGFDTGGWIGNLFFTVVYFALTLTHTGVRVARKTYVVDMAEGDRRTIYVAVSNSAMGIVLLVVGGISSLLAAGGVAWALLFLAALGLVGVFAGARLPEVSRG